jgi:hypothetical protein
LRCHEELKNKFMSIGIAEEADNAANNQCRSISSLARSQPGAVTLLIISVETESHRAQRNIATEASASASPSATLGTPALSSLPFYHWKTHFSMVEGQATFGNSSQPEKR